MIKQTSLSLTPKDWEKIEEVKRNYPKIYIIEIFRAGLMVLSDLSKNKNKPDPS